MSVEVWNTWCWLICNSIFHYRLEKLMPPRIELGTFCVLGRCDNRYTMALMKTTSNSQSSYSMSVEVRNACLVLLELLSDFHHIYKQLMPPRIELGTFFVSARCDDRYTMASMTKLQIRVVIQHVSWSSKYLIGAAWNAISFSITDSKHWCHPESNWGHSAC